MTYRKTMLSASIVAALMFTGAAFAHDSQPANQPAPQDTTQQTTTAQQKAKKAKAEQKAQRLATVQVVGIRASEQESLNVKRQANAHIDVVTAENIGKLPAENVADAIGQLPGVNLSTGSLEEGGFDSPDRVALRGTSPSLTQTLIDGHAVASADWFVLDQGSTMGRSVSYSLLPAGIVSQVKVYKTSEAKLVPGGSAGSVDIITRRPLSFTKPLTFDASVGGVYSTSASKTAPQLSALFNWKNSSNTFGVLVQAFSQDRYLSRQAQELPSGFEQILPTDPVVQTDPNLSGVYIPVLLGSTLFTQKRERKGGLVRAEWQASDNLLLNFTGFYSKLTANNYNINYMLWGTHFAHTQAPEPGYTISNGVLSNATYAGVPGTAYTVQDMIARDSSAQTDFYTLDADWNVTDSLFAKFQAGTTQGKGITGKQYIAEVLNNIGGGASWTTHGISSPVDWSAGGLNTPQSWQWSGTWGDQLVEALDRENWFKADFTQYLDSNVLTSINYGVRYSDHMREVRSPEGASPGNLPQVLMTTPTTTYPSGFASDVGGTWPRNVWYFTRAGLVNAVDSTATWLYNNNGPTGRHNYGAEYKVHEGNASAYGQLNFQGDNWSGNFGVRYVDIRQSIRNYQAVQVASDPAQVTSLFGRWNRLHHTNKISRLLPSFNFKFDLSQDLLWRFAASQTMTLPDYSALGAAVWGSDISHKGGGGNPDLKPIISTNFDTDLEWYFMPRGLLSFGVYSMDLKNYVSFGTHNAVMFSETDHQLETYEVSTPVNSHAHVQGYTISYQQPIGHYFGVDANYTYADGHSAPAGIFNPDGSPDTDMIGTSKNTWNAGVFFENSKFNARVDYNYRSNFLIGLNAAAPDYQSNFGVLSASIGYTPTSWLSFSLVGQNLNNPLYKYNQSGFIPRAFYSNGRQYYFKVNFKF
ncbi:MAG TPA: TonB-dependent receptor [Rhodanobacteraceae bacterium]